jgi:diadenosine tetraphosphatase ApaH/serine/threonine PP2A family protein phosphatase
MVHALISDVHANLEALQAVLDDIAPSCELLCLGDVVGYGPNPNECLDLLKARGVLMVLGNHDVAAIDDFGISYFSELAREAMRWTQSVISQDHVAWLNSLSYELRLPEFLLVHGAPVRYFEYCKNIEVARRAFNATDAPIIFVGHTHVAEYYALGPNDAITNHHMQHGGELLLQPDHRYIVNVGSVGQPRDLNPQASYVLYDALERRITWKRISYPIGLVAEKIAAVDLPPALGQRLVDGR